MTRDKFIDEYMERSNIPVACRTEDGFKFGGFRRYALPCACGEDVCDGWAMISEEGVDDHMKFYAPGSVSQ